LQETDRLFTCEYCRVKSYLIEKDFFRYMLPNAAPKNKSLLFFPYWRFKGMLFSCVSKGIEYRFIDASHQAVNSSYLPVSVGLRSQALKLQFVSPETKGRFIKPSQSFEKVMNIFDQRFKKSLSGPVFHQSHIGETLSLIYSPFYIDSKIYDAVLNKPVSPVLPNDFDTECFPGGPPDWRIQFIPTMCPDCGWDLDGERDSLTLSCRNCNSVWKASGNGLKSIKFAHIHGQGDNIIYFPFWRIETEISGVNLNSYADMVRVANIPKKIQEKWEDIEFLFWAVAFKVRPCTFLQLSRNITFSQPREKLIPELPDARLQPVTLPVKEAVESLKINLANFIKPREKIYPLLGDIKIRPKSYLLVYIPFEIRHREFIQSAFHLVINKKHISLAGNL